MFDSQQSGRSEPSLVAGRDDLNGSYPTLRLLIMKSTSKLLPKFPHEPCFAVSLRGSGETFNYGIGPSIMVIEYALPHVHTCPHNNLQPSVQHFGVWTTTHKHSAWNPAARLGCGVIPRSDADTNLH